MNVPLKKRHNYGKLNGSVSSHNAPSAKRLQSSKLLILTMFGYEFSIWIIYNANCLFVSVYSGNSNSEDSEYEHQSSDMDDDDSTIIGPATSIRTKKRKHNLLFIDFLNRIWFVFFSMKFHSF